MTSLEFGFTCGLVVAAVLALAYGIGWGWTGCHRWFLPCTRRTPQGGTVFAGLRREPPEYLPGRSLAFDGTRVGESRAGAGELHDEWEQLDPDTAADVLIAEWHDEPLERTVTGDVWDQWWAGIDGLERECMLTHDWYLREEALWAELKAETRELCAA